MTSFRMEVNSNCGSNHVFIFISHAHGMSNTHFAPNTKSTSTHGISSFWSTPHCSTSDFYHFLNYYLCTNQTKRQLNFNYIDFCFISNVYVFVSWMRGTPLFFAPLKHVSEKIDFFCLSFRYKYKLEIIVHGRNIESDYSELNSKFRTTQQWMFRAS